MPYYAALDVSLRSVSFEAFELADGLFDAGISMSAGLFDAELCATRTTQTLRCCRSVIW
jgi:hypothetical protein